MSETLGLVFRISITYFFLLIILRLSGKRSVANLTPLDFMISVIIGDFFDDIFWAEIPAALGITAIGTLTAIHTFITYLSHQNDAIHHAVNSVKTLLINNGKLEKSGMEKERMNEDEITSELRVLQEDSPEEIREGNLEPSGEVSLLKQELYQVAQKADLHRLKELFR